MDSTIPPNRRKNPALACLLSLVCIGAGQFYNEEPRKAAVLFFPAVLCGLAFGMAGLAVVLPLAGYAAYAAYKGANLHNQNMHLEVVLAREEAEARARFEARTLSIHSFVDQICKGHLLASSGLLDLDAFAQQKALAIALFETKKPREGIEPFLAALVPLIRSGALTTEEARKIKALVF